MMRQITIDVAGILVSLSLALLLFLTGLVGMPAVRAANPAPDPAQITLAPNFRGTMDLNRRMTVLLDPGQRRTLYSVLNGNEGAFSAAPRNGINLGYQRVAVWTRFYLRSARDDQELVLWITPSFTDQIDVFVADSKHNPAAGDFIRYSFGDNRPIPSDGQSSLGYAVRLNVGKDAPTTIYIRAASTDSSLNLSASLYPAGDHVAHTVTGSLLAGLWFGGMAVLLCIQIVFFYYRRQKVYLLIAAATFGAMLVYLGNMGLSRFLLFPQGGIGNDIFMGSAMWFGMLTSSLCAREILDLPGRRPVVSRAFLCGAGFAVIGICFALAHKTIEIGSVGQFILLGFAALAVAQSLREAAEGGSKERLTAAAYLVLVVGLVATIAQRTAFIPLPSWVAHGYALSSLIHTLLLTAALVVQLRAAEAAHRDMERQALGAARAAERRATTMVEERTRELVAAKQIAEDALRAELQSQEQQVRFLEVISHQYRTPLATIRSNVDSLELGLSSADRASRQRIERIRRGISRLVETLELNLTRSRVQGNNFIAEKSPTLLASLVAATGNRARDLLQGPPIQVNIDPESWQAQANVDADMLALAILNLLENAAKYAKIGDDTPIMLNFFCRGSSAVIEVADHGIGIPKDALPTIRMRSVRAANARTIEGSGLGLSLVSRITQTLGGSLNIESKETVGTTVTIILELIPHRPN